jgi:hypothetical protein
MMRMMRMMGQFPKRIRDGCMSAMNGVVQRSAKGCADGAVMVHRNTMFVPKHNRAVTTGMDTMSAMLLPEGYRAMAEGEIEFGLLSARPTDNRFKRRKVERLRFDLLHLRSLRHARHPRVETAP